MVFGRILDKIRYFAREGCLLKRGWRDAASGGLERQKAEAGLGHRADIVVFFDLMDVEEGRVS